LEIKLVIKQSLNGAFYIGSNKICSDGFIAQYICMDVEEYRNILMIEYNGNNQNAFGEVYFQNEYNAVKALEWVESMSVFNKLTNKESNRVRY